MPPVPEHLATLDSLLHEGLEALLREAQEKDVLLPPFGRPPLQLPFEEYQAAEEEGSDEDDDEDEDEDGTADGTADGDEGGVPAGPEFAFNYGFNPLMFLAKFLTKNNPVNIAARKLEYEKSTRYLLTIAEHAMLQVHTYDAMQGRVAQMRSGITHGPIAGCVTGSSAVLWARACKPSKLVFELAVSPSFDNLLEIETADATADTDLCGRISLANLQSGVTYYYRVSAANPAAGLAGPSAGFFATGRFTTLPDQDETRPLKFCFAPLPVRKLVQPFAGVDTIDTRASGRGSAASASGSSSSSTAGSRETAAGTGQQGESQGEKAGQPGPSKAAQLAQNMALCGGIASVEPTAFFAMGGLLPRTEAIALHKLSPPAARALSLYQMRTPEVQQLLSSCAVHLAWADNAKGAANALKVEELATQRAERDRDKRKRRKPGGGGESDPRGEISSSLGALEACWPLQLEDKVTRHTFSSTRCGTLAEVFTLDVRGGRLGKTQTEWLDEQLTNSPCLWKIVVSPTNLAASEPMVDVPAGSGEEVVQLDSAALKIQSRQRGRVARRTGESSPPGGVGGGSTPSPAPTEASTKAASAAANNTLSAEEEEAVKAPTLYDMAKGFRDARIPNIVFVSTSSTPFAVSYDPADPKKATKVYEFGAAPLGESASPGGTERGSCESFATLSKTALMPGWTADVHDEGAAAALTFGCVSIAENGDLTFAVHDSAGHKLHSATVHHAKRPRG